MLTLFSLKRTSTNMYTGIHCLCIYLMSYIKVRNLDDKYSVQVQILFQIYASFKMHSLFLLFVLLLFTVAFSESVQESPVDTNTISQVNKDATPTGQEEHSLQSDPENFKNALTQMKHQELDEETAIEYCKDAIIRGEYDKAAHLLKHISQSNYGQVVVKTYTNSSDFEKILVFADTIRAKNDNKTLILYQELFERAIQQNCSLKELMNMAANINKLYNYSDWTSLKQNLLDKIVVKASNNILDNVITDIEHIERSAYKYIDKVDSLDHNTGLQLFTDVVLRLCKTKYGFLQVLRYISQCLNLPLRAQGYITLQDFMKDTDKYREYTLYLARLIRLTLNEPGINQNIKKKLKKLASKLPSAIRIETFTDTFCIQNKKSGSYLKVSNTSAEEYQLLVSPEDTDNAKWSIEYPRWDRILIMLKNNYSGKFISLLDIKVTDTTYQLWFLVESDASEDGFYLRVHSKSSALYSYMRDEEGEFKYSKVKDDFSKWVLKGC